MILQQGAGRLYIANERAPEPEDLLAPWPDVWLYVGETKGGVEFTSDSAVAIQYAMESYGPIGTEQGDSSAEVSFGLASVTATNIALALSGATSRVDLNTSRFIPTSATGYFALGWESNEGTERWLYRRCRPSGALSISRSKADSAVVPVTFTLFGDHSGRDLWTAITADS